MTEAYCMKCRSKKMMKDPRQDKLANGRDCVKGTCPDCGTSMFKMGKM